LSLNWSRVESGWSWNWENKCVFFGTKNIKAKVWGPKKNFHNCKIEISRLGKRKTNLAIVLEQMRPETWAE
jgi:hypothetical protein